MKTQAFGWLTAAVLAAGLNASYHDGGLEWAHRAVDQIEHSSAAVVALAGGHVGEFLAEARLVANHADMEQQAELQQPVMEQRIAQRNEQRMAHQETRSCPWATAIARIQTRVARAENSMAHFEAISDQQQAKLVRFEAGRDRLEARIEAQTARLHATAMTLSPMVMEKIEVPVHCQTVRVSVPQLPKLQIPSSVLHLDLPELKEADSL
jgi:hypothetical protein